MTVKGFYKKDGKTRPITAARQTSITDFLSKIENQSRKKMLQQKPVTSTPQKYKTSLPALESLSLHQKTNELHPVFAEYVRTHYPPEKWVDMGVTYKIIRKHDENKYLGKTLRPIPRPYKVYGSGKKAMLVQFSQLPEWLKKHNISWYDYIGWQERGGKMNNRLTDQILKAIIEEDKDFSKNKDKLKLVPVVDGYRIEQLKLAEELFVEDVEEGKIKDPKGLKLSRSQAYGQVPEGGYLNRMGGMLMGALAGKDTSSNLDKMNKAQKDLGYYTGLVIKITGDYDPDLRDEHNTWAVITGIVDNYHYQVKQEDYPEQKGKKLLIRDTDVKGWIGDMNTDFIGIGAERHAKEVKPLIQKIMKEAGN